MLVNFLVDCCRSEWKSQWPVGAGAAFVTSIPTMKGMSETKGSRALSMFLNFIMDFSNLRAGTFIAEHNREMAD